ncbi:transcriptional regulator, DeoR family [Seinonella peptonophila]|uniref:Transcriptional regulator, DeoR family n=1 Tax=Seinonella peptonophila TaxID=112248 RepID=A0A1M4V609_9BACL|nr:DeoR/GlpR family DNA-binding transcription regulator [Seinonella peptonophila]SHE64369.1 transcriptional regulator, DeoR family [Seinonella peptonophila]
MLPAERQEKIVQHVNAHGFVSISELIEMFHVSKPTIMRDLIKLEDLSLIVRTYGGASSLHKGTRFEPKHILKEIHATEQKERIASLAFDEFIHPGETILLDSGTTTLMLAKRLVAMDNLTVITNDIKIAMLLSDNENIELVVLGGQRRKSVYSLTGPITENILQNLNVDKTFLGMDAVDMTKGMTNSNIEETRLKRMMIEAAGQTILLADSSKLDKVAFSKIADLDVLDVMITDDEQLDQQHVQMIQNLGIDLRIST